MERFEPDWGTSKWREVQWNPLKWRWDEMVSNDGRARVRFRGPLIVTEFRSG